jgi:hypothetical protein
VVFSPGRCHAAIDQFCEALYKRPCCFHVFAIPLLMTNRWRKQLSKATDVNFVVKPCTDIWGASQYEPLGVFISLPLYRHGHWRLRGTQPVADLARAMCSLQKSAYVQKGNLLREFLLLSRELDSMPEIVARQMFQTAKGRQVPGPLAQGRGGEPLGE